MQLIGVTGKAGSGKTTFSNILAEKNSIGVIHADDILEHIKLNYFSIFMDENVDGERTKINSKLKTVLYRNKTIFRMFMKLRAKLIEPYLLSQIEQLQNEGKEIILIDDTFIKHQSIYNRLSMIFVVNRPYVQRKEAIIRRDGITLEEAVAYDVAHFKGNYKEISGKKNVIKINNNGTEEELRGKAECIYNQYFINFRDKYKQNNANNEKRIVKRDKTKEKQKSNFRNERD